MIVKDKSVANYRSEATKFRKENFDLKKEIILLKEQLTKGESGEGPERRDGAADANENGQDNDLMAARAMIQQNQERQQRR